MRYLVLIAALGLAGCGGGPVASGNEMSVTVRGAWNAGDGFPIADQHCRQYGKVARVAVAGMPPSYDCVAPR